MRFNVFPQHAGQVTILRINVSRQLSFYFRMTLASCSCLSFNLSEKVGSVCSWPRTAVRQFCPLVPTGMRYLRVEPEALTCTVRSMCCRFDSKASQLYSRTNEDKFMHEEGSGCASGNRRCTIYSMCPPRHASISNVSEVDSNCVGVAHEPLSFPLYAVGYVRKSEIQATCVSFDGHVHAKRTFTKKPWKMLDVGHDYSPEVDRII